MNYLTRKTVSIQLQVGIRTVDRLIKTGKLKSIKIGDLVRISEEDLNQFLQESGVK